MVHAYGRVNYNGNANGHDSAVAISSLPNNLTVQCVVGQKSSSMAYREMSSRRWLLTPELYYG
jgi:hypothetical protein